VAAVPVQPQDQGTLANTGAAGWVLPAGLGILTLGAGTVALTRRRTN
jgi:LPXTG-motif cell wall-anchored protein